MRAEDAEPWWSSRALVAGVFAASVLSLLLPGTPTYDPFAWIIWGREITEGSLTTTLGPSWKPLPVAFTTVFSLFGDALAPSLWLIVARVGAIAALLSCWGLVRRLGGGITGAAAATVALGLAPWWLMNVGLGNSEGLMVFFVLAAIERMVADQHRSAFVLACGAGLLRPEVWPFLAIYGLWLIWRRRRPIAPVAVVAGGMFVLACWIVPEWIGSGEPFRAASRARTDINPQAPTNADSPVFAVFGDAIEMLAIPVLLGLAAALWLALRRRAPWFGGLLVVAFLWLLVIAAMTSGGFSGNQRYLIVPVALLIVVSGAALGVLVSEFARGADHRPFAVAAAVVFLIPSAGQLGETWDKVAYQEQMTEALPSLIERAGGVDAINTCGAVATGRFLVPQVAWYTHRHQHQVSQLSRSPGTVFVVHTTATSRWGPPGGAISARPVAVQKSWRVYQRCEVGLVQ